MVWPPNSMVYRESELQWVRQYCKRQCTLFWYVLGVFAKVNQSLHFSLNIMAYMKICTCLLIVYQRILKYIIILLQTRITGGCSRDAVWDMDASQFPRPEYQKLRELCNLSINTYLNICNRHYRGAHQNNGRNTLLNHKESKIKSKLSNISCKSAIISKEVEGVQ